MNHLHRSLLRFSFLPTDTWRFCRFTLCSTGVVMVLLLASCAAPPVILDEVGGQKEITRGQKATFFWRFQNAVSVMIGGDTTTFKQSDQVSVKPDSTKTYPIIAYGKSDSLETAWTIRVIDEQPVKQVQSGGESNYTVAPPANESPSQFYSGLRAQGTSYPLKRLKIMSVELPTSPTGGVCTVRFVPLDENGNALQNLPVSINNWSVNTFCGSTTQEYSPQVTDIQWQRNVAKMKMAVCIDRSAMAKDMDERVRQSLSELPFCIGINDKASVFTFNHESKLITPFVSRDQLNNIGDKIGSDEPNGLNSMYKSTYAYLQQFSKLQNTTNVVVIIAASTDNSSLIYTADDIIKRARETGTQIYSIVVGDAADTYPLKYIATQTGGRFYYVPLEKTQQISSILKEISYSTHGYYQAVFQMSAADLASCKSSGLKLKYSDAQQNHVEEKATFAMAVEDTYPAYQAISMFNFRQTVATDEYKPLVQSLATVLKDNPGRVIELVGHSSNEGDDDVMRTLALERTQSIRRTLYDMGVNSAQIRSRALGDLRPLYYLQDNEWQKKYNRRVEVRWLDPSIQPYEVIAEYTSTESDAIKYSEQWEKRGFKSYYERVYVNGGSAFRVKLWGYATEDAANADAKLIERKYSVKASIE
ncbi:MAG: OmpA family protein [Candidatus Kapabacteria bacterium]|nr:OmpA family protein [Candidatus Kapabacteria bacterium]